nr:MAG TPA: hypothetical protein [Caudoviricetes sp.]
MVSRFSSSAENMIFHSLRTFASGSLIKLPTS